MSDIEKINKALIIGAGPSLKDNLKEYKRLGEFPGIVLVTDAAVKPVLEMEPLQKFTCSTLEDGDDLNKYYDPDIVQKLGSLYIKNCLLSDRVHRNIKDSLKKAAIPFENAAKCRDFMNTSNVGLFCYHIAREIFNCKEIYLIGMDHCYSTDAPPPVDQKSELFQWGFYTLWNPHQDLKIVLNPAHELWREEFEFYAKEIPDTKIINCTGFGALFNKELFEWKPINQMTTW